MANKKNTVDLLVIQLTCPVICQIFSHIFFEVKSRLFPLDSEIILPDMPEALLFFPHHKLISGFESAYYAYYEKDYGKGPFEIQPGIDKKTYSEPNEHRNNNGDSQLRNKAQVVEKGFIHNIMLIIAPIQGEVKNPELGDCGIYSVE